MYGLLSRSICFKTINSPHFRNSTIFGSKTTSDLLVLCSTSLILLCLVMMSHFSSIKLLLLVLVIVRITTTTDTMPLSTGMYERVSPIPGKVNQYKANCTVYHRAFSVTHVVLSDLKQQVPGDGRSRLA